MTHFEVQDKIILTCFFTVRVFVQPIKELGFQGHILSVLLPDTNELHPFVPGIPLTETPTFPSLPPACQGPDSAPTFPRREGRQGPGKPFFPLQRDALLVLEGGQSLSRYASTGQGHPKEKKKTPRIIACEGGLELLPPFLREMVTELSTASWGCAASFFFFFFCMAASDRKNNTRL